MKKNYSSTGKVCRVTFRLPKDIEAESVTLVGDFNDWDKTADPLTRRKDGSFSTTISLDAGQAYRFRYWVDDERWENDWDADQYVPNEFGTEDSVISV